MNGVTQSTDDGTGWDAAFLLSGINQGNWCSATGYPRALAAYPGAVVTIGNATGGLPDYGLRTSDCQGNWVFSGISFRGQAPRSPAAAATIDFPAAISLVPIRRALAAARASRRRRRVPLISMAITFTMRARRMRSALFQADLFFDRQQQIDMGWNLVEYVHGCRGVQVHSSPLGSGGPQDPTGHDQFNISIHDNTIHDTQCDGLIVDTVDPSQGPVTIYNNVVYNAGVGPDNPEATGAWNCIDVPGGTENGPAFLQHDAKLGRIQRGEFRQSRARGSEDGVWKPMPAVCAYGTSGKQFAFMVKYGMTPMQAIQAATSNAADLLGHASELGIDQARQVRRFGRGERRSLERHQRTRERRVCHERRQGLQVGGSRASLLPSNKNGLNRGSPAWFFGRARLYSLRKNSLNVCIAMGRAALLGPRNSDEISAGFSP